jgi:hypothetical protein
MVNRIHRVGFLVTLSALLFFMSGRVALSQVTLVRDGKVRAVVVTAAKPSQVATYAVEELVNHVKSLSENPCGS